jgi:hypothetical protein
MPSTGPVPLSDAMAELMARYPMTPERAASNARILGEEVAAWEQTPAGRLLSDEELAEFTHPAA